MIFFSSNKPNSLAVLTALIVSLSHFRMATT